MQNKKQVLIIGAGPAGLTAGLELLRKSKDFEVIIIEALDDVGGISRTLEYKGNRMDIGGHRFFSKNDWVMDWWQKMMPEAPIDMNTGVSYIPESNEWMLIRSRLSRIYFLKKFFSYPISLSLETISNLGLERMSKIGIGYIKARLFPIKKEKNLEDFFYNRFGDELYRTFFRDYTEKVWGVPCSKISAAWGAQRIKGLSITKAVIHAIKKTIGKVGGGIAQKDTETSLIERFMYPKLGPGQMWNLAAKELQSLGGKIIHNEAVVSLQYENGKYKKLISRNKLGNLNEWSPDFIISTMPIKDLVNATVGEIPKDVRSTASGLVYRDFITMGLLVKKMRKMESSSGHTNILPDTWIYIQEPNVQIGRLQIFNNWSPALVKDESTVWLGLEYFCQEGDQLWNLQDKEFSQLGIKELASMGMIDPKDVIDSNVVRIPKAYPAYFGSYDQFYILQNWFNQIPNMFLVGRNGMHRYNNQDHSMLTAKLAAESILIGKHLQKDIWNINVEEEYHETKKRI